MNVSIPLLTMHWLAAASTFLIAVGSGFQAVSAILDYRVELRESGIQTLFATYLAPVNAGADLKVWDGLRQSLQLFNPVYVLPLWWRVVRNISGLLRIPNNTTAAATEVAATEVAATAAAATAAAATATATAAAAAAAKTVVGEIVQATVKDLQAQNALMGRIATEDQNDRAAKAARMRQLLFTGMVWMLIMYGSLFALGAVGIQLYLDYKS